VPETLTLTGTDKLADCQRVLDSVTFASRKKGIDSQ
jgi:hypothetical protein